MVSSPPLLKSKLSQPSLVWNTVFSVFCLTFSKASHLLSLFTVGTGSVHIGLWTQQHTFSFFGDFVLISFTEYVSNYPSVCWMSVERVGGASVWLAVKSPDSRFHQRQPQLLLSAFTICSTRSFVMLESSIWRPLLVSMISHGELWPPQTSGLLSDQWESFAQANRSMSTHNTGAVGEGWEMWLLLRWSTMRGHLVVHTHKQNTMKWIWLEEGQRSNCAQALLTVSFTHIYLYIDIHSVAVRTPLCCFCCEITATKPTQCWFWCRLETVWWSSQFHHTRPLRMKTLLWLWWDWIFFQRETLESSV